MVSPGLRWPAYGSETLWRGIAVDRQCVIAAKRCSCGRAIRRPEKRETSMGGSREWRAWLLRAYGCRHARAWEPQARGTAGGGVARVRALPAAPVRSLLRLRGERYRPRPRAQLRLRSRSHPGAVGPDPAKEPLLRPGQAVDNPASERLAAARRRLGSADTHRRPGFCLGEPGHGHLARRRDMARARADSGPGGKPGRVPFAEKDAHLTITLHRTPTMLCLAGHCLHKWVVVRMR
jgi:hypothetical protein